MQNKEKEDVVVVNVVNSTFSVAENVFATKKLAGAAEVHLKKNEQKIKKNELIINSYDNTIILIM